MNNYQKYKETYRKYREANREKRKEYNRNWRKDNPEKHSEYQSKWAKKNKERVRVYQNNWFAKHPDADKIYHKRYRTRHPDRIKSQSAERRGAIGTFTSTEWEDKKKKFDFKCAICGISEIELLNNTGMGLTLDHIIPLSKDGLNVIDNIQPLCKSCNSRKGNRVSV